VRRQSRRSALTAAAMVIGLALLILSRTIADGAHDDWIRAAVRLGSGHITIEAPGYQARRDIKDHLAGPDRAAVMAALADSTIAPRVLDVAPRVELSGLASAPASAIPVSIVGVDPARERAFSELETRLTAGRYLEPDDRLQACIGAGIAERLHLQVGDRLVLTAQALGGSIEGQMVRVVGLFRTGIPDVDQSLIHIPLATAEDWLGLDDGVTTLAVLLDSGWDVDRVTASLRAALAGRRDRVVVLPWREAMPELDAAIRVDDAGDYIFHVILFAIVALAIVNTILMSVMYRTREFGVIRALGLRKRDSATLVMLEAMMLTGISGVVGVLLGLAVTWVFFRHGIDLSAFMGNDFSAAGVVISPVFVPQFRLAQIVQSLAFIVVIGVLASLYPAYRATRIDIAEAMKFEA
jgi:putative ABC transport system permease protein